MVVLGEVAMGAAAWAGSAARAAREAAAGPRCSSAGTGSRSLGAAPHTSTCRTQATSGKSDRGSRCRTPRATTLGWAECSVAAATAVAREVEAVAVAAARVRVAARAVAREAARAVVGKGVERVGVAVMAKTRAAVGRALEALG